MLNLFPALRQSFWLLFWLGLASGLVTEELRHGRIWAAPPPSAPLCPPDLAPAIAEIIESPPLARSHWGILIQPLDSPQPLYSLNAQKFFVPASNTKLLSSAAALLELTPNFRFRTPLYATGTPPDLKTLRLVGGGDPSLTSEELKQVAQRLKEKGVRQISQLLVQVPDGAKTPINPTWEWEDIYFSYGVNPHPLSLNENAVTLTLAPQQPGQPLKIVWSDAIAARQWSVDNQTVTQVAGSTNQVAIRGILGEPRLILTGQLALDAAPEKFNLRIINPSQYFLESWQEILQEIGIKVQSAQVINSFISENSESEIAVIESNTLSELIKKINQDSNNLYAESLIVDLEQIDNNLTNLGVGREGYRLVDASGLSRHNLISPATLVQTLILMKKNPYGEVYKNSLAVAGSTGTLAGRFQETDLEGKLRAKTGTLSGVVSLSGYLDTGEQGTIAFSIMVNNSEQAVSILRNGIDAIVLKLGQLKKC